MVDCAAEIKRMKKKYDQKDDDGRQIKPNFFGKIARKKGYYDAKRKNYKFHETTMDYLQHSINGFREKSATKNTIAFSKLLIPKSDICYTAVKYDQVDRVIGLVRDMRAKTKLIWSDEWAGLTSAEKREAAQAVQQECMDYIKNIHLSRNTAYRLLLAIEDPQNKDISRSLFFTLFSLPNQSFIDLINEGHEPISMLEEVSDGDYDIEIFDFKYKLVTKKKLEQAF